MAPLVESPRSCWQGRQSLWTGTPLSLVAKFSVLPADIAKAMSLIREPFPDARIVAQSTGLGLFGVECESNDEMESAITELRHAIQVIKGALVLLSVPSEVKKNIDVFGPPTDAYPLMVRVKQQFDPHGVLNPGRFWGGI